MKDLTPSLFLALIFSFNVTKNTI